eukprot:scaffold160897_cov21-Prasinocladus_malaysianus.AAC.1
MMKEKSDDPRRVSIEKSLLYQVSIYILAGPYLHEENKIFGHSWAAGMATAVVRGLPHYTMEQLRDATDDFATRLVIGNVIILPT